MLRVKKLVTLIKLGNFLIRLPTAALFLQIHQFLFRDFSSNSMSQCPTSFIILRRSSEQPISISTSSRRQQSNCFPAQLDDFDYHKAEKHPNLGNWAYMYMYDLLDENLTTLKLLAASKKKKVNLLQLGALKFWQH